MRLVNSLELFATGGNTVYLSDSHVEIAPGLAALWLVWRFLPTLTASHQPHPATPLPGDALMPNCVSKLSY